MQIFIGRDGQQTGPFTLEQVQQMLAAGSATGEDLAWFEGAAVWMPLSQVPGITGNEPPPPSTPRLQPIQGTPRPTDLGTSGAAVASLVLGILAWLILPFIGAIAAVITGHVGLSSIKKSLGSLKGRGMAITGLVLGYIQIALIPVIAILAALAVPAFSKVQEKAEQMKSQNNARQILMACRVYAADHDGAFPPSLDVLVPDLLPDRSILQTVPPSEDGEEIGFEYTSGLTDSDFPLKIVLRSKLTYSDGKQVVGYVDGSVQVVKPDRLPPQQAP